MRILSTRSVIAETGLSRTTIWRLERQGHFPKRLQLSPNRVGWKSDAIRDWIESRPLASVRTSSSPERPVYAADGNDS